MIDLNHTKKTFVLARNCPTAVACIWSLIRYNKGDAAPWLIQKWSETQKGITKMSGLLKAVHRFRFKAIPRQLTIDQLETTIFPLIIFVEKDDGVKDFVVCYGFDGRRFLIGDTSWGLNMYYAEEVKAMWIGGITLDLFAEREFITKKQHWTAVRKLIRDLTFSSATYRNDLLKKWISDSVCDFEKDIRFLYKVLPWFLLSGILCILLWTGGIALAFYKEVYSALLGWLGLPVIAMLLYSKANQWRYTMGIQNLGKLKKDDESLNKNEHSDKASKSKKNLNAETVWNWRVFSWACFISIPLALSGWPDYAQMIGIAVTFTLAVVCQSLLVRIKEIIYILYWVYVELQEEE